MACPRMKWYTRDMCSWQRQAEAIRMKRPRRRSEAWERWKRARRELMNSGVSAGAHGAVRGERAHGGAPGRNKPRQKQDKGQHNAQWQDGEGVQVRIQANQQAVEQELRGIGVVGTEQPTACTCARAPPFPALMVCAGN